MQLYILYNCKCFSYMRHYMIFLCNSGQLNALVPADDANAYQRKKAQGRGTMREWDSEQMKVKIERKWNPLILPQTVIPGSRRYVLENGIKLTFLCGQFFAWNSNSDWRIFRLRQNRRRQTDFWNEWPMKWVFSHAKAKMLKAPLQKRGIFCLLESENSNACWIMFVCRTQYQRAPNRQTLQARTGTLAHEYTLERRHTRAFIACGGCVYVCVCVRLYYRMHTDWDKTFAQRETDPLGDIRIHWWPRSFTHTNDSIACSRWIRSETSTKYTNSMPFAIRHNTQYIEIKQGKYYFICLSYSIYMLYINCTPFDSGCTMLYTADNKLISI